VSLRIPHTKKQINTMVQESHVFIASFNSDKHVYQRKQACYSFEQELGYSIQQILWSNIIQFKPE